MPRRLLFILLLTPALCAHADTSDDIIERARAIVAEGNQLREAANQGFAAAEAACYRRFLVNRCLAKARQERLADIQQARELEIAGKRMELAERQRMAAERQAERERSGITPLVPAPTPADSRPSLELSDPPAHPDLPPVETRHLPASPPMEIPAPAPAAAAHGPAAAEVSALPEVVDVEVKPLQPLSSEQ